MSEVGSDMQLTAEVKRLLTQYAGWNRKVRPAALHRLREIGPPAVDVLHEMMRDQTREFNRQRPGFRYLLLTTAVGFAVMTGKSFYDMGIVISLGMSALAFLTIFSMYYFARKMQPKQQEIVCLLAELKDPRSTMFFVSALKNGDINTKVKARAALTQVMPKLNEKDAESVPIIDRPILYRQLQCSDRRLQHTILSAIPMFDDTQALPMVEKLAKDRFIKDADSELHNLALATRTILIARRAAETSGQTLLRASSDATSFPETALRAANADNSTTSDLLLRATMSDNSKL